MARTTVDVVLSVIDHITRPISAIQARINRLTAPIQRVGRAFGDFGRAAGIDRLAGRLRGVTTALGGVTREAGAALMKLTAMAGVSLAGVTASLYGVLRTGGDFERYSIMMTGLFDGDSAAAKKALAWSENFAQTTNLGIDQAVQAYLKLKNVGIDPTLGALQALTDYNAKMGGGFVELDGIMLATTQMWGKGKIQAEEMNQLIERQVPAWQLLSRATGKTVADLMEMGTKGKLGEKYIRALVTQMGKESVGASEAIGRSWDGIIDRMGDAWLSFNKSVADAGVFDAAKESLERLLSSVQRLTENGQLQTWAKNVSDTMTRYLVAPLDEFLFGAEVVGDRLTERVRVGGFIADLPKHMESLAATTRTVADAFKFFYEAIKPAIDLVGGPANAAMFALAGITFGPLIGALATLAGSFIMLGTAILTTPVGWILGAAALIGGAAYIIWRDWDQLGEQFADMWSQIVEAFRVAESAISGAADWFNGLASSWFSAIDQWLADMEAKLWQAGVDFVTSLWDGIKSKWEELKSWLQDAFTGLTSWMPDWAKDKLGLNVTASSDAAVQAATPTAPNPLDAIPFGNNPGGTVGAPSSPMIYLPEIVVPSLDSGGGSSSTSSISTSTVDASSVNVSNFQVPEPIIANQPQNVNVSAPFSATISGLGLTEPEVRALIAQASAAHADRMRAATLSALED